MQITGVRAALLDDGRCVAAVDTDGGLSGLGIGPAGALGSLAGLVDGLLVGRDPRGVVGLWQRMMDGVEGRGSRHGALEAVAVLDLALWDLKAKLNDEPLWRTLGGLRPRIYVHAASCDPAADDAAVARWYGAFARDHGVRGAFLPAADDVETDLRRLGLARSALEPRTAEPALLLELGERFAPKDASRRVRAIEQHQDLTLVRDPARRRDAAGLKRVSNAIRAAVCAGGRLSAPDEYLAHFHAHALDVVELGVSCAGITGALQVADTAFGFELPVLLGASPGNLHAHLGAVIPGCLGLEVREPVATGPLESGVRIEDGWAIAGDRPGHGVTVDPNVLGPPAPKRRRRTGGRA